MGVVPASNENSCYLNILFSHLICIFFVLSNIQVPAETTSIHALLKMYQLVQPFQIPNRTTVDELENIHNCQCPRVYWPVCGDDQITYVNACIVNCLKKTFRRYGPCITYRRNNVRKTVVYVPSAWKVGNTRDRT